MCNRLFSSRPDLNDESKSVSLIEHTKTNKLERRDRKLKKPDTKRFWECQSAIHSWAANYRGLGLADMARGIADRRPHRANSEVGLHVLAVMEGILRAAAQNRRVIIEQGCERPAPLSDEEARDLLA